MKALETIQFPVKIGGHLALDFTNTTEFRGTAQAKELFHSYTELLAWCWRAGLTSDQQAERIHHLAERQPKEAKQICQQAIEFREALYSIFSTITDQQNPQNADLEPLNTVLQQAQTHHQLTGTEDGFAWQWANSEGDMASVLWAIALTAADLLTSEQLVRVRKCPNCGWLFLDTSRNGMRRWCSMDFCGSLIKSRRQYERKKSQNR
jgi:predicted RNA-binding Zn ribbon-like protein